MRPNETGSAANSSAVQRFSKLARRMPSIPADDGRELGHLPGEL